MKIFLGVFGIAIVLIAGYVGFMWITYIDDTVTIGSGYGFNIGETKVEAFQSAKNQFSSKNVFILYPLDKNNWGPHRKVHFSDEDLSILAKREMWQFYFDQEYFDSLRLTFKSNSLISIYRHRKKFELP